MKHRPLHIIHDGVPPEIIMAWRGNFKVVWQILVENLHHIVNNIVEIYNIFITHFPKNWGNVNEGKNSK